MLISVYTSIVSQYPMERSERAIKGDLMTINKDGNLVPAHHLGAIMGICGSKRNNDIIPFDNRIRREKFLHGDIVTECDSLTHKIIQKIQGEIVSVTLYEFPVTAYISYEDNFDIYHDDLSDFRVGDRLYPLFNGKYTRHKNTFSGVGHVGVITEIRDGRGLTSLEELRPIEAFPTSTAFRVKFGF